MDEATMAQQNAASESSPPPETPADPKKAAHEAAEAERKAEWEAKQAEKKEAEQKAIDEVRDMSDEDAASAFAKRLDDEAERLTRRKMKASVTEFLQGRCRNNPDFARLTLQPCKKIINCFKFINRHALAYLKKSNVDGKSGDVPDELCYQWAADYFSDADTPEDKGKDDTFVPKKFYGSSSQKAEHERAEAERLAAWEARQTKKVEAEGAELEKMFDLSDEDAVSASVEKLSAGLAPLIQRNMKICVTDHLQSQADAGFIRQALHPRKNLSNCFRYIQRLAMEYLREEAANNGEDGGMVSGDVPDGLCYQWAADYFCDPDAEEDKDKDDEFAARPYYGGSSSKTKKKAFPKKPEPPKQIDLDLGWG
jgi:hypothetical protein